MSSDYNYDEDGHLWPFFAFTLTFIITVPLTYLLYVRVRTPAVVNPRLKTDYKPKGVSDHVDAVRASYRRKQRNIGLAITVVLGWVIMAYMLYLIRIAPTHTQRIWNPYDILGISESATEKQIKKTYKDLSRKLHPDKVKPDPAKNETAESLNAAYVEISKAYQALTDEEIRNNYIQYGHPDGKQSYSIGIALPKIMITDGNGKYVVLFYFLVFGVGLPWLVGSWWYGNQRMSKEGVLMESANRLFIEYKDDADSGDVISALSTGKEFETTLAGDKAESGLSALESRITAEGDAYPFAAGMLVKDKDKLQELDNSVRRKALALLWAYLGRIDLDDVELQKSKFEIATQAHALTRSQTAISLAYANNTAILSSYHAAQLLIQAMPPKSSPLLQLPHMTPAIAKAVEGDSKIRMTIQKFMDQPDAQRRSLAVGNGLLSEQEYKTAVQVARQLPYLRVDKAFFKVAGERFIIPSSLVTLVVKGRFIPPGSENVPAINELDLEDVDPAEDDIDAISGRKPKQVGKDAAGKPILASDEPVYPPLTFAPFFGRDVSPRWHVFLTDSKQGKMAVPPFTFSSFDRPLFEADGSTPTYNMQTLKAQFQAPPQPGNYTFVMHVVCDSYVGFDTKREVTLVVDEASRANEVIEEDEISEPEEGKIFPMTALGKQCAS
jgi:translocation protein SEC63